MTTFANLILYGGFLFAMLCTVFFDFEEMRIPNWISIMLVLLFMVYAAINGSRLLLGQHALWGAGVFVSALVFYVIGWLGAGDVKLAAAVALWMGPAAAPDFLILTAVLGGAFALFLLAFRQFTAPPRVMDWHVVKRLTYFAVQGKCPYGIPMAVSAVIAGGTHFQA